MGGIVASVDLESIAEDLGWQPGNEIISINGHPLRDVIDYRFYSADEFLAVLVKRGDQQAEFEIEKDFDIPLGVNFTDILFDGVRTCGAHCVFCFVEQLPRGMRRSLYLKDDDYRLSFLQGNFVTLGNVSEDDISRIIEQRLSPLYISVHTTDPELRERMLGREAPKILDQIDAFTAGSITMHTQIVLCRGINDGEYLDRTVADLAARYPNVASIAVVPAGLTEHRRNKTPIGRIDAQYSADILDRVGRWQNAFLKDKGTRLVWAADEFYISAGRPFPKAGAYEGFPQIENGIGLARKFKDNAARARRKLSKNMPERSVRISIVTGELAAPLLREWADSVRDYNLEIDVHAVPNRLFGRSVTVAGLIGGNDIIEELRGRELGDALFVPSVAVREGVFLDDVTVDDVGRELGVRVLVVRPLPTAVLGEIL